MNDYILKKIQKLLALAGSPNEQEAKVAMAKANELLVKHNLDMQQVNSASLDYEETEVESGLRAKAHTRHVAQLMLSYFFVKVVHHRVFDEDKLKYLHKVVLIGKPVNAAIASQVFQYLMKIYPQLWRQFKLNNKASEKDRYSYYYGLTLGIGDVLDQSRLRVEEERGLVVVEDADLDKHVKELCEGKVRKEKKCPLRKRIAAKGFEDGRKVRIHAPIESKVTSDALMIGEA